MMYECTRSAPPIYPSSSSIHTYLSQYTKKGSGYKSTDEALKAVRGKSQCEWLSVTNCDNVYGSDVIARVFRSSREYYLKAAGPLLRRGSYAKKPLDMIIMPVDSRSFKGKFSGNGQIHMLLLCHSIIKQHMPSSSCDDHHRTSSSSSCDDHHSTSSFSCNDHHSTPRPEGLPHHQEAQRAGIRRALSPTGQQPTAQLTGIHHSASPHYQTHGPRLDLPQDRAVLQGKREVRLVLHIIIIIE